MPESLEQMLSELQRTIADTEERISVLERQIDAAQAAQRPSFEFEATLRGSRALLSALFARRESLFDRIALARTHPGR